jgi:hypothetical protein
MRGSLEEETFDDRIQAHLFCEAINTKCVVNVPSLDATEAVTLTMTKIIVA